MGKFSFNVIGNSVTKILNNATYQRHGLQMFIFLRYYFNMQILQWKHKKYVSNDFFNMVIMLDEKIPFSKKLAFN